MERSRLAAAVSLVALASCGTPEVEESFWDEVRSVGRGSTAFRYDSVGDMRDDVDVVVLGRVVEVREGRPPAASGERGELVVEADSTARSSLLVVAVDEVLHGTLDDAGPLVVETVALTATLDTTLPSEPAVFFVLDQVEEARRSGLGQDWIEHGEGYWVLPHPDGIQVEGATGVGSAFDAEPATEDPDVEHSPPPLSAASTIEELASEVRRG